MSTQWQGKKWYCYGTSMTDRTNIPGYYSRYLAKFAGLEEHNFGKAGSGIIPKLHGEDNVKSRCMCLSDGKAQADLITVEVIPNDMKGELGNVHDVSDDTFCGNLHQVLEYLQTNTNAVIAVLSSSRARYEPNHPEIRFTPLSKQVQEWMAYEDAVATICRMHSVPFWNGAAEAGLGYYRIMKDDTLVQDQIHLTEKGGELLAQFYWGKLKNVFPNT